MRLIDADKFKEWLANGGFCDNCQKKGLIGCANCEINYEYKVMDWIDAQPTVEIEEENKK